MTKYNVILEFRSFSERDNWAREFKQCARHAYQQEPWLAASVTEEQFVRLKKLPEVKVHPDLQMAPMSRPQTT